MNTSLFSGVTVLELGQIIAGPFAASMLADFGATIIKVEQPGKGDTLRSSGPTKNGEPLWWKAAARNKKCITVDLSHPRGQALISGLVKRADVVIENFRPGTLERWNLGWEALQAINPKLIMLRISGYGQSGPESHKPGFGRVGEAMSGAVHLQGYADSPPSHYGFSLGDLATGLMGAFALSGALYKRSVEGDAFAGECIDLALYETLYRLIDWQIILYDQLGFVPQRNGNHLAISIAPISNTYETKDGKWITIASVFGETLFRILEMIGGTALRNDPRFATPQSQMEHREELDSLTRAWVLARTREEALRDCEDSGTVAGPILNPEDIVKHDTYAFRDNLIHVPDAVLGEVMMHGITPRLFNYAGSVNSVGPSLGQHNSEVLMDLLGLPAEEYASLEQDGVI
jgi:crotonobetainyl-CoA:carnitine CoA-transferase CaiB-like acyl-CoA transferase